MAYFYPTRTVALPVTSDGMCVKDAHGVVVARCEGSNPFLASAMCDLINAGAPVVRAQEEKQDAIYERRIEAMLARSRHGRS